MLANLPILSHESPQPSKARREFASRLARRLRRSSAFSSDTRYRSFRPRRLVAAPTVHLEDFDEIVYRERLEEVYLLQNRARLRAGDGDYVVTRRPPPPVWASYCRDRLQLGDPLWLQPRARGEPQRIATDCWVDRETRRELVHALRRGRLRYLHPYKSTRAVWQLAALLHRSSRRPIEVIGPPPALARAINDKLWFADVVRRLLGDRHLPPTAASSNLATLTLLVRSLSARSDKVVVKMPDAAGGYGNLVYESQSLRDRPPGALRSRLRHDLQRIGWHGQCPLLVGSWESQVLSAPSSQLWIPPLEEGGPIVEALCQQVVEGSTGLFVGSRPAGPLPGLLRQKMVDDSWLLARLFQRLGYVGRCSFDMLLVGDDLEQARVEFVECNGRWGGSSLPMTLVNRLVGDWQQRPYFSRTLSHPQLARVSASRLLSHFEPMLLDAASDRGWLVIYDLGPDGLSSEIGVLGLGDEENLLERRINHQIPAEIDRLASTHPLSPRDCRASRNGRSAARSDRVQGAPNLGVDHQDRAIRHGLPGFV